MPDTSDEGAGYAALALVDGLISILKDKGALSAPERKALIASTMDRLQADAEPHSLAGLDALQRLYVSDD